MGFLFANIPLTVFQRRCKRQNLGRDNLLHFTRSRRARSISHAIQLAILFRTIISDVSSCVFLQSTKTVVTETGSFRRQRNSTFRRPIGRSYRQYFERRLHHDGFLLYEQNNRKSLTFCPGEVLHKTDSFEMYNFLPFLRLDLLISLYKLTFVHFSLIR